MNKNNVLVLSAFLLVLVFLSGCNQPKDTFTPTNPYISGNKGVTVSFEPNSPPSSVFQGSSFPVTVKLENDGYYTIPAGELKVTLSGFNPVVFGIQPNQVVAVLQDNLNGVSELQGKPTSPGITDINFPDFTYNQQLLNQISVPIMADVCYHYQTEATGYLCVKKDLFSNDDRICSINGQKTIFSSAAPVQISDLSETGAGNNKIQFIFTIKKADKDGSLYKPGSECSYGGDKGSIYSIKNKVFVNITTPNLNGDIKCSGMSDTQYSPGFASGYAMLYNDAVTLRCTETVDNVANDFKPLLYITISYDYDTSKMQSIGVQKSQ